MNELIFCDVMQKFSKRFAKGENFSEIGSGEIGSGACDIRPFAADLNHTDHFVARENRCANNFLNRLASIYAAGLHTFKNGGVARRGKAVVDLRTAFTNGACGESRVARQWNEAHVAQRFGKKKIKMTPLVGEAENADFFRLYVEVASDALGDGGPRDRRRFGAGVAAQRVGQAFEFRDKAHA